MKDSPADCRGLFGIVGSGLDCVTASGDVEWSGEQCVRHLMLGCVCERKFGCNRCGLGRNAVLVDAKKASEASKGSGAVILLLAALSRFVCWRRAAG